VGVLLTPIVVKEAIALADLRGRRFAVDANGELYQFLALIRQPDGTPLHDSQGRITSHLSGLFYRTTRLIADFGLQLVFVFDGRPPVEKAAEIARRRAVRDRYEAEAAEARRAGDLARAYSKSTMTSRLTAEMVASAKRLLELMGVPVVQAPSEAEAQAAHMARRGDVWAAASKDYDALLFGAPRLLRFLTISGREFLPTQRTFRPITPELIDLERMLEALGITHGQLIDLGLLVGTDFHPGVKGIGPKKALALVTRHGAIEHMPSRVRDAFTDDLNRLRQIYLEPEVRDDYRIDSLECDVDAVVHFLCEEHAFGRERVMAALERAFGSQKSDPSTPG
jgi:flap endonuclease-1